MIARRNDDLLASDLEEIGCEDFKAAFGYSITPRHIRDLFKRTLSRAGASENFERLEIYLDERPKRKALVLTGAKNQTISDLENVVATFKNPAQPSQEEFEYLWVRSFDYYQAQTDSGRSAKKVKRSIVDFIFAKYPSGSMVLIEGDARTGKSFAAKAWCDLNPGQVRYCQVPSTSDDFGFYRAIARSLGVASAETFKAQQIRLKIEDTLQNSRLMLILDEAHYLWLSGSRKEILPKRVNWLLTALVNYGVPVAMIATPQFLRTQKEVEKNSGWTSEQLVGRIYHFVKLPASLNAADLASVAKSLVPEANEQTIEALVCYAQGSAKYLAGIDALVKRARYVAQKQGREKLKFSDVAAAIKESVMPSDSALAAALENSVAFHSKKRLTIPPQTFAASPAGPDQRRLDRDTTSQPTIRGNADLTPITSTRRHIQPMEIEEQKI